MSITFTPERIAQLAAELEHSERTRVQVEHFSKRFAGMTIDDGYAVAREWVRQKIAGGRKVIGHKIGLTYVSCSPYRVPVARLAAAQAAVADLKAAKK